MRLPAHLLLQLRVGVGVGTVLLAGCDLAEKVESAIDGGSERAAVAVVAAEAAAPETKTAPATPSVQPEGLAGKVAKALDEARPEPLVAIPRAPAGEIEPVPREEPEDVTAFVPFGGASAKLPPRKVPPRIKPRAKPRPEAPLALAPTPDEPCDPAVSSPVLGSTLPDRDPCPACGRG